MHIQKISKLSISVTEIDVDHLLRKIKKLQRTNGVIERTVNRQSSDGVIMTNTAQKVHKPSWNGQLNLCDEPVEDNTIEQFRCGRE